MVALRAARTVDRHETITMINKTKRSFMYLLAVSCMLATTMGCGGVLLTPEVIDAHGGHTFEAEQDVVFKAAEAALKTLGYEVSNSSAKAGIIKTAQRDLRTDSQTQGSSRNYGRKGRNKSSLNRSRTTSQTYTRSYELRLSKAGSGTHVVATPRIFRNGADISAEAIWVLEGTMGEQSLWQTLFDEVASNVEMAE